MDIKTLDDLANVHAQFREKLRASARATAGPNDYAKLVRNAKEQELAALDERAKALEQVKAEAVKRIDNERTTIKEQVERLKKDIEGLKRVTPPKLETAEGPVPMPPLPSAETEQEPAPSSSRPEKPRRRGRTDR